ncbi:MAG: PfkB family carbohydrate kinase, partial [Verrucomicrobiia bacterium]
MKSIRQLFGSELRVINLGLAAFKPALDDAGVAAVQVDWRPPVAVAAALRRRVQALGPVIEAANAKAVKIILGGLPHLVGLERAIDVIPGMKPDLLLHAGPPVTWDRMCGPMRGAVIGALLYERRAASAEEAQQLAASGAIEFSPCHAHAAVGPMAGVISPSMPVFVLKNEAYGNQAFCTMNEGLGKVLRYGAYGEPVIDRLRWMETTLYPALKKAVAKLGQIDLKTIIAQALHMGDELHNRNRAATSLFYRAIAPAVVATGADAATVAEVLEFINHNDHFFLNLSMPASKVTLDAARGIKHSSIVVAMARNGTEFGVQLSGTGDEWFTGPAPVPDALYFPGYSRADANPDIVLAGVPTELAYAQTEQLVTSGALTVGGSAAIMACGAARLGLRTAFVALVGDDAAGRFMIEELHARGVDTRGLV